jgi:hypothetical protein
MVPQSLAGVTAAARRDLPRILRRSTLCPAQDTGTNRVTEHLYHILADLVVVLHLAFILFAALGGLLALRWRWMPWLHLPAVVWAVLVELTGWICPLTPVRIGVSSSVSVCQPDLEMSGSPQSRNVGFL